MDPIDPTLPHKQEIISALMRTEPTIKRIFLFGSRARKDNRTAFSDIDIGVVARRKLTFYQLARLNEALEHVETLHTIEVVDFTNRADDFSREAMSETEELHGKE